MSSAAPLLPISTGAPRKNLGRLQIALRLFATGLSRCFRLLGGDHQGRPTSRRGTEIRARPPGRGLAAWRQSYFFFLAPVFFVDFLVVFFAVFLAAIEMAPPCEASYFFRPLPAPGRQKSERAAINTCSRSLRQSGHKCR